MGVRFPKNEVSLIEKIGFCVGIYCVYAVIEVRVLALGYSKPSTPNLNTTT